MGSLRFFKSIEQPEDQTTQQPNQSKVLEALIDDYGYLETAREARSEVVSDEIETRAYLLTYKRFRLIGNQDDCAKVFDSIQASQRVPTSFHRSVIQAISDLCTDMGFRDITANK